MKQVYEELCEVIWESGPGGSFTMQRDITGVHGEEKRGIKVTCCLKAWE